jgi:hypothetical protein
MSDVEYEALLGKKEKEKKKKEIDADLRTDIRMVVSSSILRAEAAVSSKILVQLYQTNGAI